MLPEHEIKNLILCIKVDAVIYENKSKDIFENIKKQAITKIEIIEE